MMAIAMFQWRKVAAARRWPVAAGKVIEARVDESSDSDGGLQYSPYIKYQYIVPEQGQRTFTNDLIAFGSRNLSEGGVRAERKVHATVAKYAVGSTVQVHYDPREPTTAVLEVRSAIAGLLVLIGVIFLVTGVGVAVGVFFVNR